MRPMLKSSSAGGCQGGRVSLGRVSQNMVDHGQGKGTSLLIHLCTSEETDDLLTTHSCTPKRSVTALLAGAPWPH